jgi:pimeloyl-ACP methyl ester carboxylesterase
MTDAGPVSHRETGHAFFRRRWFQAGIGDMVRAKGIPGWLVVNEFDTRAVLANYPGPVLILHGTRDQTFPVEHAHSLHAASPHATLALTACGHNDCPPQWELVLSFLARNGVISEPVSGDSQ